MSMFVKLPSILHFTFFLALLCNIVRNVEDEKEDISDDDEEIVQENGVYVLNEENFDDFVNTKDTILVEFYAPWCSHCKKLAPEFEKAAKTLSKHEPPVYLAKVDCATETNLADRFSIEGYPTLKIFKNGVGIDYQGSRDDIGIVDHMKTISDPNYKMPENVTIVLTSENFTEITQREEFMVVMFYAPWCGHCKKLMPEYEKASVELIKKDPPILMAIVDATKESEIALKFSISAYPTLKIFRRGKDQPFDEEARDKWSILNFLEKHKGPPSSLIDGLKELKKKIIYSDDTSCAFNIIAFFQDPHQPSFEKYIEAANQERIHYTFYHSFHSSHQSYAKVHSNSIVLFLIERFQTKHEPTLREFKITDESTSVDILEFIHKYQVPLVGEYNKQTKDKIYKDKTPLILFFYTVDWSFEYRDATQQWRKKFADIAIKHAELTFVIADDEENKVLFNEFGFDESGEEINVGIISRHASFKYPMKPMEEFDARQVFNFINQFNTGKLKPRIKSQAVPSKQKGPVTVVVGKSFEKIVFDEKKDVLIELYAPWCGHCKKLEPIYKELAKELKSEKNLLVAKMDASTNDVPPNYSHSGFPTIYFAPSNNKNNPIPYEGDRTMEALKEFIKTHSVASFVKESTKEEL